MATSMYWYGKAFVNMLGGETAGESKKCDYLSDTMKVALLDDTYPLDQATDESWADVSAYEISGAGYVAGGQELAGKTLIYDPVTHECQLDALDSEWDPSSIVAKFAVLYTSTPEADADKILLGFMEFETNKTSDNGPFKLIWNEDGILKGVVGVPA